MASLNVIVVEKLPTEVGVPVISVVVRLPFDDLIDNPGGRPVALHIYGSWPPLPVIVNEYGVPKTPPVMPLVTMVGVTCANTSGAKLMAKVNKPKNAAAAFNRKIIAAEPVATGELF
jgi:hypothetical protein